MRPKPVLRLVSGLEMPSPAGMEIDVSRLDNLLVREVYAGHVALLHWVGATRAA